MKKFFKALRYVAIFAFAGWAGAAAALKLWPEMLFFIAYLVALYYLGKIVDKHHSDF